MFQFISYLFIREAPDLVDGALDFVGNTTSQSPQRLIGVAEELEGGQGPGPFLWAPDNWFNLINIIMINYNERVI